MPSLELFCSWIQATVSWRSPLGIVENTPFPRPASPGHQLKGLLLYFSSDLLLQTRTPAPPPPHTQGSLMAFIIPLEGGGMWGPSTPL